MSRARILDTSGIDMNSPEVRRNLDIDLRRMDALMHEHAPAEANAYSVRVTQLPNDAFEFSIQYGNNRGGNFYPLGETVRYTTGMLPFL